MTHRRRLTIVLVCLLCVALLVTMGIVTPRVLAFQADTTPSLVIEDQPYTG